MDKDIKVKLKVWRQKGPKDKGQFETYQIDKINQSVSFLEMLDILNERLVSEGKEPIVFDHDCREGICGMCSLYVNGAYRADRLLHLLPVRADVRLHTMNTYRRYRWCTRRKRNSYS